jgi:hypothetical protein
VTICGEAVDYPAVSFTTLLNITTNAKGLSFRFKLGARQIVIDISIINIHVHTHYFTTINPTPPLATANSFRSA